MEENLRNLKLETELRSNNTFDLDALNKVLQNVVLTNFWKLYNSQYSKFNIKRFDLPIKDFIREYRLPTETTSVMVPIRYVNYINYEFIDVNNRKPYRRSKYFEKMISQEDIANNNDLFTHNYLLFINGKFITTTEILPYEDKICIILDVAEHFHDDGIPIHDYLQMVEDDLMVTIFIVPNYVNWKYDTNMYTIDKYNNKVPLNKIPNGDKINDNTICLSCINNGVSYEKEVLEFKIDKIDDTIEFLFDDRFIFEGDNKPLKMDFLNIDNHTDTIDVTYEYPVFTLDKKMPEPYENIILLSKKENEFFGLNSKLTLDMYYPNIYKVRGLEENEVARAIVIYNDDLISKNEEYVNELSLYYKYAQNIIDRYVDESIPRLIKTYQPIKIEYGIKDFDSSIYVPYVFDYKVNKLKKFIELDPNILTKYLVYQIGKTNEFYIDISKIDLSQRIREDTSKEFPNDVSFIKFDEPRYVFSLRTQFLNWGQHTLRVFLDGIFLNEQDYILIEALDYYYFYIPCSKVNPNSILDIEKFKVYDYDQQVTFNDAFNPAIISGIGPSDNIKARDIFMIDVSNMHYISRKKYIFKMVVPDTGVELTIDPESNVSIINDVKVYPIDESIIGIKTLLMIKKHCTVQAFKGSASGQPIYQTFQTRAEANNVINNYRIFRNGRLLPYKYVMMTFKDVFLAPASVIIKMQAKPKDVYTVDCTTNYYKEVLYDKEIEHHKGYIDLYGRIDKPISLKWYDIYVNGVKLHKYNIDIISPTKFFIKNINSLKHLYIVEKNRDEEVFHLPYVKTINDNIFEQLDSIRENILINIPEIEDTMENLITELIDNISEEILIFFENYLKYTFIDPNTNQVTDNVKLSFPELIGEDNILLLDANPSVSSGDTVDNILMIDCNVRADIINNTENKTKEDMGGMSDRFGTSALFLTPENMEKSEPKEMMIDYNTGITALKRRDGTVIPGSEIQRLKKQIDDFTEIIKSYNLRDQTIYNLRPDDDGIITQTFNHNDNMLDSTINLDMHDTIGNIRFYIDLEYLLINTENVKELSQYEPNIEITYSCDNIEEIITKPLSIFNHTPITIKNNNVLIKSIKVLSTVEQSEVDTSEFILHSMLIAIRSEGVI